jgi:hypothetical protein
MKGIVVDCLKELVIGSFGQEKWSKIMIKSNINPKKIYNITDDVDDELVLKMFGNTCEVGGLSFEQACDAFGEFWVASYTQKRYPSFYEGVNSSREFLMKLDDVHTTMRKRIKNAQPPKLSYTWKDNNRLIMVYHSYRDLTELFAGAVRGVAKYFNDKVEVKILDRKNVEITFLT